MTSATESEYNTPQLVCEKIRQFFGGAVALDAASNPESNVGCRSHYGRQSDGTFVDALALENWALSEPKTCFLNPPGGMLEGNRSRQAAFVDKLTEQINRGGCCVQIRVSRADR